MGTLESEMSFYRKYHMNPVNVTIHVFCIPMILLTSMWLINRSARVPVSLLEATSIDRQYYDYFNLSLLISVFYAAYYAKLDFLYGLPTGTLLVFANIKFSKLVPVYGADGAKAAWIIWVLSWIAQFIGHGKFEHRAPALLDSLLQALVLAPFFAVFEVFHFFGIRTHIIDSIDASIKPEVDKFHAARKSKAE